MNYYCYISGLQDAQIDNLKSVSSVQELTDELVELLSPADLKLLDVLRREYDNANLMALLADKDAEISPLGVLNREDWLQLFEIIEESDALNPPRDKRLLPYHLKFYNYYTAPDEQTSISHTDKENFLASLYYEYGMNAKNKLVRDWFEFNLNVNNILSAITARRHEWNVAQAVVGNNVVAETIRNSATARDFNLKTELDYYDQVAAIAEMPDLLERERRIDLLKWQWLDEHTVFEYFSIEKILVHYIRCRLIHRWDNLSVENGAAIFRNMIDDMKKGVKFN